MNLILGLLFCITLAIGSIIPNVRENVKIADKELLEKQKFLLEIVYRIEEPLMFEAWIKLGSDLVLDQSHYVVYNRHMDNFYSDWKRGKILERGQHFGSATRLHMLQFPGLFNFFYYAKDWETFVQNVCWSRLNINEGMFVHALTLAVIHRNDTDGLMLPSIYEILPQHFFNSKFVLNAEKFDYNIWIKQNLYENELIDVYRGRGEQQNGANNNSKSTTNNVHAHTWQWWKVMGFEEKFYSEEICVHRDNVDEYINHPGYDEMMKDVHMIWMPVDYTRDTGIFNSHSRISYFTEDLGWNAYWYYLNYDYPYFLQASRFGLDKDRQAELWMWNVEQILARYYMERLSHGFGDVDELSWMGSFETGYNSQLISYNGVTFSSRKNSWKVSSNGNVPMLNKLKDAYRRMYNAIDLGYLETSNGTKLNLRKPDAIEYIGNLIKGRVDIPDYKYFSYWITMSSMYVSEIDLNDRTIIPGTFTNFETMLRDPLFYGMYKIVANIFHRFKYHLPSYTRSELLFAGVTIESVQIDKLMTFFDLMDFDVTNLLNDRLAFVDGQFQWNKMLLARQQRLNHYPFNLEITLTSEKAEKAIVRTFLGPKYDEYGRILLLVENRVNFVEMDAFTVELAAGKNVVKRCSKHFHWTANDRIRYTEAYRSVMLALNGSYELPLNISQPHCAFPERLILPRGWHQGMPMQMFFMVTPYTAKKEQFSTFDPRYSCGIGSGTRHIDNNVPFGYPLDRVIDEREFFVPNMFMKDVLIYHESNTFRMST